MEQRRIIDRRRKEKFMMDDEYLNGQARLCGWQSTLVYNSLCRHANIKQESFPSIKLMAEQHGVGRNTILKGIKNLEKRNVIKVEKKRTKDGKWLNNVYILLDKSEWDYSRVPVKDMVSRVPLECQPCPSGKPDGVPVEDTKETHSEGNTFKDKKKNFSERTVEREQSKNIVQPVFKFYEPDNSETTEEDIEQFNSDFGCDSLLHSTSTS